MTNVIYFTCKCDPRPFGVTTSELADAEGHIACEHCGRMCKVHALLIHPGEREMFFVVGERHEVNKFARVEITIDSLRFQGLQSILIDVWNGFDTGSETASWLIVNEGSTDGLMQLMRSVMIQRNPVKYLLPASFFKG